MFACGHSDAVHGGYDGWERVPAGVSARLLAADRGRLRESGASWIIERGELGWTWLGWPTESGSPSGSPVWRSCLPIDAEVRELASEYLRATQEAQRSLPLDRVADAIEILLAARARGSTVFICGNGGSASTASHMAVDLSKGSAEKHGTPIRALALTDNMAVITAVGNDIDFKTVFAWQLAVLARRDDVLVAISVSGKSPNVLEAVRTAKDLGVASIAFTGAGGGQLVKLVDVSVIVESDKYGPVEDAHLALDHMITHVLRAIPPEEL